MDHGGQKLSNVIILGYLDAILVPIYFGGHRVSDVASIRHSGRAQVDPSPGDHFRLALQNQQTVVNQFRHRDRTQVPRGGQQTPVDMIVERFGAKGFEFQFVDQVLDRIRKLSFVIPDKLSQRGFRFGSRRWSKIIRKTEVNTVDLCQLLVGNSCQFGQGLSSIWHSLYRFSRAAWPASGKGWKLFCFLLTAIVQVLNFDVEGKGGDSPVPRAP
jgi:hypothetical protein